MAHSFCINVEKNKETFCRKKFGSLFEGAPCNTKTKLWTTIKKISANCFFSFSSTFIQNAFLPLYSGPHKLQRTHKMLTWVRQPVMLNTNDREASVQRFCVAAKRLTDFSIQTVLDYQVASMSKSYLLTQARDFWWWILRISNISSWSPATVMVLYTYLTDPV